MLEYVLRFLIGGIAVSAFAILGDIFRPKSFSGLFAAAPSVALGTLAITLVSEGGALAAEQGFSMVFGAVALAAYSWTVAAMMRRPKGPSALSATLLALPVWFLVAFGLRFMVGVR
ncbi:DUF3147 family protein [Afipia sp. TerB]